VRGLGKGSVLLSLIALGLEEANSIISRSSYMMVVMHEDLTTVNWGRYAIDEIVFGARNLNRTNPLLNTTVHGCPVSSLR
jgi:hypothetical protein